MVERTSLETIKSQTQQDLQNLDLPNGMKEETKKRELKAVSEFMANLAGDVDATPTMMVDEVVDNGLPMVHVAKQKKVGVDGDDISIGSPHKGDGHAKSSEDPLGRIDMKRQPLTEAQGSKVVDDQHNQLLQMAMLCESVQKLRVQVKDGFAIGGRKRHEDNIKLTEEMSARMDEGLRNEERARRLVQNVLPVMKEEIKVRLASGTFATAAWFSVE